MPPKELPGFYFDTAKNRYFPIPHGPHKRAHPEASSSQVDKRPGHVRHKVIKKKDSITKLIPLSELHGRIIPIGRQRYEFQRACEDVQVSRPMVWMYKDTEYIAESALENLHILDDTFEGEKAVNVLALGSISGELTLHDIRGEIDPDNNTYMPAPLWPFEPENLRTHFLSTRRTSVSFESRITSIRKIGGFSLVSHDDIPISQSALVTTLGCGEPGGRVHVFNCRSSSITPVASFDCTLWSAACHPYATKAAVGTSKGACLVNLETRKSSWICHCRSDTFSVQFDNSGNVVLCGLRNGAVIPVDIRQKPRILRSKGMQRCSNGTLLPSAVCSLATLASDDNFFFGSSMDGSIRLFDRRLSWKAVQSYDGHVNSHTHLQLGVSPSETHILSGGEDSYVRIWNIKSGRLLFEENLCDAIVGKVCWPQNCPVWASKEDWYDAGTSKDQSWGVWLGSRKGLYYMHGT